MTAIMMGAAGNMLDPGGGPPPAANTTWNPADKNANVNLTNGNLTADAAFAADHNLVRATKSRASGQYYFEVVADTVLTGASDRMFNGVCTSANPLTDYVGQDSPALGYRAQGGIFVQNNVQVGTGTAYNSGNVIMCAVNFSTLLVWFGLNGTWTGGGDPAAGTGAVDALDSAGAQFPALSLRSSTTQQATGRFDEGQMQYSIPAGFLPWNADDADSLITMPANPINIRTRDTSGGVGTATAIFIFNTLGQFLQAGNNSSGSDAIGAATDFDVTSWYAGKQTDDIGNDYEIFVTNQQVTGVNGVINTVPTLDTWLPLSTNRTFDISSTGNNVETSYQVTWDISIRDVATMTVLATSTIDLRTNLFGP